MAFIWPQALLFFVLLRAVDIYLKLAESLLRLLGSLNESLLRITILIFVLEICPSYMNYLLR